jgi:hypothetical protein
MQKLSGKARVNIYKSCSVFHKESNKIKFAFFWFVYHFVQLFQESA